MKQQYQPPDGSPAERLDHAFRTVLDISRIDPVKGEAKPKRAKERKKRNKKPS